MGARYIQKWSKLACKSHIAAFPASVLLLDDFACRRQESITDIFKSVVTFVKLISGGYTCVLQPFDVDCMRSLKDEISKSYMSCAAQKYVIITDLDDLPALGCKVISAWIKDAFDWIQNTYNGSKSVQTEYI